MLAGPALGDPVARQQAVAHHPDARPKGFSLIIIESVGKVHHQMALPFRGVSVTMNDCPLRGRNLGAYTVIGQGHGIITGGRCLRFVGVAAPVATLRPVGRAGVQLHRADSGHQQHVPQVGVARAAQVRMGEAHDRGVVPAIARAEGVYLGLILPCHVVRDSVGVRAHLHASEGDAGPGEGVPHSGCPDKGVYILRGLGGCRKTADQCQKKGQSLHCRLYLRFFFSNIGRKCEEYKRR